MDTTESVLVKYPPGDTMCFGTYNGQPIRWRVLDQQGDQRLLLAEDALEDLPYSKEYDNTYWQTSSLRKRLNQVFIQKAFSFQERVRIINTRLKNLPNPRYQTSAGNTTVDKVFLLSMDELEQYLPHDADRALGKWWWVRTPGMNILSAVSVYEDGTIYDTGINVHFAECGVRPAMWIRLQKEQDNI